MNFFLYNRDADGCILGENHLNYNLIVQCIEVDKIVPNPQQPRRVFEKEALQELSSSIASHGVIQPITVRRVGGLYELIAGERRLRATQIAGLKQIPAIVTEADDEESAVLALIENIQRENLSYMEEALGYLKLAQEYHMTQEEIAKLMGKTQSAVANKLRILRLCGETKRILAEYGLTERHARALLRLTNEEQQVQTAKLIAVKGMNVRETEEYIEDLLAGRQKMMPEVVAPRGGAMTVGVKTPVSRPKIKRFIRDIRLFTNTVNRAALYMKEAGVPVQVNENKNEGYYEMVIRVPYQTGGV